MARLRTLLSPVVLAGVLLGLAACVGGESAPPPAERAGDPLLLGHAAWCGTNPPSGYCPGGYKR